MNMTKWAADIIASPKIAAIPIMTHPGIEINGNTVEEAVKSGEIHAAAVLALDEKYPSSAPTLIMDLTVEADAFGAEIEYSAHDLPNVIGRRLSSAEEVASLEVPEITAGRVPEFLKANRIIAQSVTSRPVFAGCIGPFSLAGRLYEMTEIMMAIYTEPETATMLLEKCSEFIRRYITAIKATGASGVMMAEPAAGLLSNEDATEYSSKYIKKIVDELQDENFIIIHHNCGNTGHCTASMVASGAAALSFGNKIDMVEALKETPANILAIGNLDPVSIIKLASAEQVAEATDELLAAAKPYSNFICSTGCDVPPNVPAANIEAFYSVITKHNN